MKSLSALLSEEETLQFREFTHRTAWELGEMATKKAYREDLPVLINIDRGGQTLFHSALPGTGPDNTLWIEGKKRVTYHFRHSSYYISRLMIQNKKDLEKNYHLNPDIYRVRGGAFPLCIERSGLIGVMTISGLKDQDDHAFAVEILRKFLEG